MIEWFKVSVLKTGVFKKYRGFESHSILLKIKARDGLEPSLKDLQSFTLPLCYLAKNIMKKNNKLFIYKNKIILTNGSSLNISSVKYIKNYQLNFDIFQKKKTNKFLNKNKFNFYKKIKNF